MGAGILPATIKDGKLYFLFGKENKYEKSAPGYSDFGGGTDNNESYFETAIREAGEELTGFLGNDSNVRSLLKKYGTYPIDNQSKGHSNYRMHIFPLEYDEKLPYYYNNNQKFLQKRLDPNVIKKAKIFEKESIRWICVDELPKMRGQFRYYFEAIVDKILKEKDKIYAFVSKLNKKGKKTKIYISKKKSFSRKNKTKKLLSK